MSFFSSQARAASTNASRQLEGCAIDGVPFVRLHHADDHMRGVVSRLGEQLITVGTLNLKVFNENAEFDLLFGRKIPLEDDHVGKFLLSGRVAVSFEAMREANPNNRQLLNAMDAMEKAIVQKFTGQGSHIQKIGVIIRLAGRAESQLEHVDGRCSDAGASTTKSILIPLRTQRSTLFVDARTDAALLSGKIACPLMFCGDVTEHDADKCVHNGYCSSGTPDGDIVSMTVFASISFDESLDRQRHSYAKATEEIGCIPNAVISSAIRIPPVKNCVVCSRDIVNRNLACIRVCVACNGREQHGIHVICDACNRWPCDAMPKESVDKLKKDSDRSSILSYIYRSQYDEFGNGRRCEHPTAVWQPLDIRHRIRLYFNDEEIRHSARWILRLHVLNVLDAVQNSEYATLSVLELAASLLGSCSRRRWLVKLVLSFACIYLVQSDDDTSDALFFNVDAMDEYIQGRKARLNALVDLCSSPTALDYEMFGRPLMCALSTQESEVSTRCSCVNLRDRPCSSGFDVLPKLRGDGQITNPKYSMMVNNMKSKYEVKSGTAII